ncbi:ABC-2 type transport system ATP-binding protein [Lachnospiraceae bacterium C7]|nr:ABC-2 type transport system ATP-binding protein [Lachnospiraceae bacterium C7]
MIEIKNLVKKYGEKVAVDNLDLTIENGKIYGFLGPNGAGKSTTMNIVTGYIGATSGEVIIDGHDIFKEPEEAKKCIGYLPEIPPLYVDMTVLEYLKFVAELKKIPKNKRKEDIESVMETTQIADVSNRMIRNLSKGYRQRVGFAQAILGYPDIIILDEPTVGLDPKQIIEIRDLIKELGKKHTVILSSHILSEISAVCDEIFIISKGKLVANDTTENILALVAGNQELQVKVPKDAKKYEEVLDDIHEVASYKVEENENDIIIQILADGEKDIREKVFKTFASNDISILEMSEKTKSLEDAFLELTQEGEK